MLLILAGVTIIPTLGNDGVLGRAQIAELMHEIATLDEEYKLYCLGKTVEAGGYFAEDLFMASKETLVCNEKEEQGKNIYDVMPSLKKSRYKDKTEIIKGKIYVSTTNKKEAEILERYGMVPSPFKIIDGVLVSDNDNLALLEEDGVLVIPGSVKKIASGAFANMKGSDKKLKKIIIPGSVKEIEENAFSYNETLEEVFMEEGVEKINSNSIRNCKNLEKVHIANTVYFIGGAAFAENPKLTTVNIPVNEKLNIINSYVFHNCISLKKIEIPENIENILNSAFSYSGLTEIRIHKGIKKIANTAFTNCKNLNNIIIDNENNYFILNNGILIGNNGTEMLFVLESAINGDTFSVPNGITKLDGNLIGNYNAKITKIVIPMSVSELKISFLMYNSNITSIIIDDNNQNYMSDGKAIYNKDKTELICYYDKSTKEITVPYNDYNVTTVGEYSFMINRDNVTSIKLQDSITTIKNNAFMSCGKLTELSLGKNLKNIDGIAIYNSAISKITVDPKNEHIGVEEGIAEAKVGEEEKRVNILYTIDKDKSKNKLIAVYPPINKNNYTTFKIPYGIKEIGDKVFSNWQSLNSITIPNTVTEIGSAFNACTSLTSITIPENVKTIQKSCFSGCINLKEIIIQKSEGSITGAPWGATIGGRIEIKWQG